MSNTTSIRRAASIAGATGIIALSMAGPASAQPDPGTGSWEEQHCSVSCYQGPDRTGAGIPVTPVDGSGLQVLQLGAGVLAGVALAGAGMSLASRRSHSHQPHPA